MAQTQLSPPVPLWLSDSAQKQSAPFVCDLSHYYTVVPSGLLCCCGRQLVSSKLIRHCNDSLNERFTPFSGLHCGFSVCVRNFYRFLAEKSWDDFILSLRICADIFFFFCSIWKESGRIGKKKWHWSADVTYDIPVFQLHLKKVCVRKVFFFFMCFQVDLSSTLATKVNSIYCIYLSYITLLFHGLIL